MLTETAGNLPLDRSVVALTPADQDLWRRIKADVDAAKAHGWGVEYGIPARDDEWEEAPARAPKRF